MVALESLALIGAQVRAEMEDLIEDFAGLEVSATTIEVNIPSRRESSLLIVRDPNTPAPAVDGLMAAAAPGLAGRRPLGTVDARSAMVRRTSARGTLQSISIRYVLKTVAEPFKELLWPLVGCARRMEPHYHVPFRKEVRKALAETQLSALDGPVATAALRAAARSPYKDVSHAADPRRCIKAVYGCWCRKTSVPVSYFAELHGAQISRPGPIDVANRFVRCASLGAT